MRRIHLMGPGLATLLAILVLAPGCGTKSVTAPDRVLGFPLYGGDVSALTVYQDRLIAGGFFGPSTGGGGPNSIARWVE